MHHRRTRRCLVGRGALRVTAATPQPIGTGRHRTHRIGATLIKGARIVLTPPPASCATRCSNAAASWAYNVPST
jgi:hypothetical protein